MVHCSVSCVSSCVFGVTFVILLTIITHDETKARKRVKKASGKVHRNSSSLAVTFHVIRRENTSSGSAKQLKLVGLIL